MPLTVTEKVAVEPTWMLWSWGWVTTVGPAAVAETVRVAEQLAVFPAASVAVHVTTVPVCARVRFWTK